MNFFGPTGLLLRTPLSFLDRRFLQAVFLHFLILPGLAAAQEIPNIQALEAEYLSAQGEYQAAFFALEALERRNDQALEEFDAARASDDRDRTNRAVTNVQRLAAQSSGLSIRVEEKAAELRDARSRLISALGERLEELIRQRELSVDPEEIEDLTAILRDENIRYLELRSEEDPETTLEPMRDIVMRPTDTPQDLLLKAGMLDFRATQYVARMGAIEARLEGLREDQRRDRSVRDMVAGLERFGDTRLPVTSPVTRTVTPPDPGEVPAGADTLGVEARPLTLEERIESLELLLVEMENRLREIRAKAERFRRRPGGGGGV